MYKPLSLVASFSPTCFCPKKTSSKESISFMYAGMSETSKVRVPTNRLSISNKSDWGEPYLNQTCGVNTFPADLEIFLPPLSRNISYFAWDGGSKQRISRQMRSLIRTESA